MIKNDKNVNPFSQPSKTFSNEVNNSDLGNDIKSTIEKFYNDNENKLNQNQIEGFEEKVLLPLKNSLRTWQFGIVKYCLHNKLQNIYPILVNFYEYIPNNDGLFVKTVKKICDNFAQEIIFKDIPKEGYEFIAEKLKERDRSLSDLFRNFLDSLNLEKLIEDIKTYISQNNVPSPQQQNLKTKSPTNERLEQSKKLSQRTNENILIPQVPGKIMFKRYNRYSKKQS